MSKLEGIMLVPFRPDDMRYRFCLFSLGVDKNNGIQSNSCNSLYNPEFPKRKLPLKMQSSQATVLPDAPHPHRQSDSPLPCCGCDL